MLESMGGSKLTAVSYGLQRGRRNVASCAKGIPGKEYLGACFGEIVFGAVLLYALHLFLALVVAWGGDRGLEYAAIIVIVLGFVVYMVGWASPHPYVLSRTSAREAILQDPSFRWKSQLFYTTGRQTALHEARGTSMLTVLTVPGSDQPFLEPDPQASKALCAVPVRQSPDQAQAGCYCNKLSAAGETFVKVVSRVFRTFNFGCDF